MAQLGERLVTSRYFVQLPHIRRCHSNRGTALPESGLLLLATLTQLLAEDQEAAVDLTLGIQTRRSHEGVEPDSKPRLPGEAVISASATPRGAE